jgi:hypothetical protein
MMILTIRLERVAKTAPLNRAAGIVQPAVRVRHTAQHIKGERVMRLFFVIICLISFSLIGKPIQAAQSSIADAEGSACMGDDKSRKQTEQAALNDAKKKAVEFVSTLIRSETSVKNFELDKDLLSSYANAEVKVIKELKKIGIKMHHPAIAIK